MEPLIHTLEVNNPQENNHAPHVVHKNLIGWPTYAELSMLPKLLLSSENYGLYKLVYSKATRTLSIHKSLIFCSKTHTLCFEE